MLPPIVKPLEAGALSPSGLLVDLYHKGKKIFDYLQEKHILFLTLINPFSQKGSPILVKSSTHYQKTVYLFLKKGLPFQLKRSTFFAEKVDPF